MWSQESFVVYITTPAIPSCFMAFVSDPYSPFEIFNFYYIICMPSCLTVSKFIDDTKIYNVASNPQDTTALQRDLDSATLWSERWDMYFNPTKSIHLHINAKAITEYRIADTNIVTKNVHKDLGIDDLSWNQHYEKLPQKLTECGGCFDTVSASVSAN